MKVLNLYAGVGGNRKDWTGVEVTAVEPDGRRIGGLEMGVWDDVDMRDCERCGEKRNAASMSCCGPAKVWLCAECDNIRRDALNELFKMGQHFENES